MHCGVKGYATIWFRMSPTVCERLNLTTILEHSKIRQGSHLQQESSSSMLFQNTSAKPTFFSSYWGEFPHAAKLPIIFFCWVVVGRARSYERRPIPTLQIKQINLNRHESNIHPDLTSMVERLLKHMINHSWCVSWHISIITPREVTCTEIMCVNIAYFQH